MNRGAGEGYQEAHIPDHGFSEAMPLASLRTVLVDGVQREGLEYQCLGQPLDKVGVSIAEQANRQRPHPQLSIKTSAKQHGMVMMVVMVAY